MEEIKEKVNYCLNCKTKPCSTKGCPLENNIPEFIKAVKEENYKQAYNIKNNSTTRNMRKNMSTYETMSRELCKRNKRRTSKYW